DFPIISSEDTSRRNNDLNGDLMTSKIVWIVIMAMVSACGSGEDNQDTAPFQIIAYGEEFVEDHIPAADVVDGWRIEFDTFLIVLGDITVNTTEGTTKSPKRLVLDLRKSSAAK